MSPKKLGILSYPIKLFKLNYLNGIFKSFFLCRYNTVNYHYMLLFFSTILMSVGPSGLFKSCTKDVRFSINVLPSRIWLRFIVMTHIFTINQSGLEISSLKSVEIILIDVLNSPSVFASKIVFWETWLANCCFLPVNA